MLQSPDFNDPVGEQILYILPTYNLFIFQKYVISTKFKLHFSGNNFVKKYLYICICLCICIFFEINNNNLTAMEFLFKSL